MALNPWTKVDGSYINSEEDVGIVGAIARGIDVSEWQERLTGKRLLTMTFHLRLYAMVPVYPMMINIGEYNTSECERLGLPYGVYFYSYANDVRKQNRRPGIA